MKFGGVLLAVRDIAAAKRFYQEVLGRELQMDNGNYQVFKGGLALLQGFPQLAQFPEDKVVYGAHNAELFFETDTFDSDTAKVKASGTGLVHDVLEQPWGQRVIRFYDPDGHIVELGESMRRVVVRFLERGMSVEEAARASQFPVPFVLWCKDHPDEDPPEQ